MPTENTSSLLHVDYMPLKVKGAPVKTDTAYTVYGRVLEFFTCELKTVCTVSSDVSLEDLKVYGNLSKPQFCIFVKRKRV